ncbi:MotA/TolQ/ExbB proton channel family protein [Aquibaculum arenosum]|uniref:MotA/TolQ/ExbB proton channel family protein n=1 Tax=Aquibaculum arenosum TaxID=3032591 RepID=A0ABT5YNW5_9PROT|nr:MotA/TolQ/ExbB proton channel family protein [Fodinicurvata sp. CAU 1616]MDF2096430.1 MotA/TolQ/ExbB proton channel family protein [Fodinicurvata sp. CAU 1616]
MDESETPAAEGTTPGATTAEPAAAEATGPEVDPIANGNDGLDGMADAAPPEILGLPAEMLSPLAEPLALLQAGGAVVAILLVLSVVALAIILMKLWQFGRLGVGINRRARAALALYRSGRAEEALNRLTGARNPGARLLALAIRGRLRDDLPEPMLREELARLGSEEVEALRGGFRPLEVIGALAPLLGLFGTVLGMIAAFQALEQAGNRVDPSILSGGIWEALLTTAVGLAVAIPVVALLNLLERRVERQALEMESLVTQVFTVDLTAAPRVQRPAPDSHEGALRLHAAGE